MTQTLLIGAAIGLGVAIGFRRLAVGALVLTLLAGGAFARYQWAEARDTERRALAELRAGTVEPWRIAVDRVLNGDPWRARCARLAELGEHPRACREMEPDAVPLGYDDAAPAPRAAPKRK